MTSYKQVFLGGHLHGQRRMFGVDTEFASVERSATPPRFSYTDYDPQPKVTLDQVDYIGVTCDVFGARLRFYILAEEMYRKDELVRDFLLFGMET